MAPDASPTRCQRRQVRRRQRAWIPCQGGRRAVLDRTYRAGREVPVGAASREDAPPGVRPVRSREPEAPRSREARDVQLPRLHAHLWEEEEQRTVHGAPADDSQAVAGETE